MFRVFIKPKVCGQYYKNTECNSGLKKKKKLTKNLQRANFLYSLLKLFYFNGINKEHTEYHAKLICLEQIGALCFWGKYALKLYLHPQIPPA